MYKNCCEAVYVEGQFVANIRNEMRCKIVYNFEMNTIIKMKTTIRLCCYLLLYVDCLSPCSSRCNVSKRKSKRLYQVTFIREVAKSHRFERLIDQYFF